MWKLRTAFSAGGVTSVWLLLAALLALFCVLPSGMVLADPDQVSDDCGYDAKRHVQLLEKKVVKLQKEFAKEKSGVLSDAETKDLELQLEDQKNKLKSKLEEIEGKKGAASKWARECLNVWDDDTAVAKCIEEANSLLDEKRAQCSALFARNEFLLKHCLESREKELKNLLDWNTGTEIEQKLLKSEQNRRGAENKELEVMDALWKLQLINGK